MVSCKPMLAMHSCIINTIIKTAELTKEFNELSVSVSLLAQISENENENKIKNATVTRQLFYLLIYLFDVLIEGFYYKKTLKLQSLHTRRL